MKSDIFNSDIEIAILNILLKNGYEIFNVFPQVTPDMFSAEPHRVIYRAMAEVAKRGYDSDKLLVREELIAKDILPMAGGEKYIDEMFAREYNRKSLAEYIQKLQTAYKTRELLALNARIPRYLENPYKVDSVISELNKKLNNLVSSVGTPDVSLVSDSVDEVIQEIIKRRESPGIHGISTGFPDVDALTGGLTGGNVWYIGGRPGMCKTVSLTKIEMNVGRQGIPTLLFNREMKRNDMIERMMASISGVPLSNIRQGTLTDAELKKITELREIMKSLPFYIDNNFSGGIDYIIAIIRKYHQLYGIKVVGVDYIQLLVERDVDATQNLGKASRQLKLLASELDITILIVSQLNREVEKRENRRPLMADLRQSGNMEEDADIVIAMYRDEVYNVNSPAAGKLEFIIRKSRNGPIGTVILDFDADTVNLYNGSDDLWNRGAFI